MNLADLIYLSPVPWSSFDQRPQKFVKWYHAEYQGDVLWVDPYPTRLPSLNDLRYSRGPVKTSEKGTREHWLDIIVPRAIPIEPLPASITINRLFWKKQLDTIKAFSSRENCVLVAGKPSGMAVEVFKNSAASKLIYDAMDEYPEFYSGLSRRALVKTENELVRISHEIWASSTPLFLKWKDRHENVKLIRNGLDISSLDRLDEVKGRGHTIFGYVGTVGKWFDWDMIIRIAELVPADTIKIVGPIFSTSKRPLPPNVLLFPPCRHQEAIKWMASFDVGLIPFLSSRLTRSVDPIKYYEYRGLGLPVISTNFGEMTYRQDEEGVYVCSNELDVQISLEQAKKYANNNLKNKSFLMDNSWDQRFRGAFDL